MVRAEKKTRECVEGPSAGEGFDKTPWRARVNRVYTKRFVYRNGQRTGRAALTAPIADAGRRVRAGPEGSPRSRVTQRRDSLCNVKAT